MEKSIHAWVDDEIKDELPKPFSGHDLEESWRSLFAVAEFYSGLSRGFATSLDYPYPGTVEENVMRYVTEMRDI